MRVRRRHPRRAALAAACAVVLILVAGGIIRTLTAPRVADPASLPLPAPAFTRYGVTYGRVAVAYLDTTRHDSVTVTIPTGNAPVAVYASCRVAHPHSRDLSAVNLTTTASYALYSAFSCPARAVNAIQLNRSGLPDAGTRLTFRVMDSYADAPADAPAAWAFAIYAVTIPGNPPPPPEVVASLTVAGSTYRLVRSYHGFWPSQRTVSVTIPAGESSIVAFQCPAPLAGKEIYVEAGDALVTKPDTVDKSHSTSANSAQTCASPDNLSTDAMALLSRQHPPPDNVPSPVTFTLTVDPRDQSLAGQWVIGVYQQ
jgi:hypothetical protein